jgi:adenine-specific DNA-methyltransferase
VACFIGKKSYGGGAKEKYAATQQEYVFLYAKDPLSLDDLWLPQDAAAEARYYKDQAEKLWK